MADPSPTPPGEDLPWRIAVISDDDVFLGTLRSVVEHLKRAKPEFGGVEVTQVRTGRKWRTGFHQVLSETFLVFCEEKRIHELVGELKVGERTEAVVAIIDRHDLEAIQRVFWTGYLHLRGVVARNVADPEDLGPIARTIKEEFRRTRPEPRRSAKPLGWKVGKNSAEARRDRKLVSLFLDPVMRDFMQSLVFTVDNVRAAIPERPWQGNDTLLYELFGRIGDALTPRDQGQRSRQLAGLEAEAREMLAGESGTALPKPGPILLEGETGSGKTVITEWIRRYLSHDMQSPLPLHPISTVNVGAGILEAEFFGTISGAWTGSVSRPPKLLLAWGGVVFLDEIGELPPEVQAKLLVYLDDLRFTPDGWPFGWRIASPVYIVAATNKNLREEIERGTFRRDLYHRFPHRLRVPPLRERRSDLRPLIDFVLQDPAVNTRGWVTEISIGALARLEAHAFPGNFRELESILTRAVFRAMQAGEHRICEQHLEL